MTNQTRVARLAKAAALTAGGAATLACVGQHAQSDPANLSRAAPLPVSSTTSPGSSEWLALLPDGEEKRRFVLDCTGCHQFDAHAARTAGRARTRDEWHAVVARMNGYAGASTRFPVISAYREPAQTADWLSSHLNDQAAATPRIVTGTPVVRDGAVTEYAMPEARDLPHDVAIDDAGQVVITGMMTHRMYVLTPSSGHLQEVDIPVPRANPRAIEIDRDGNWWVVLGAPHKVARYEPRTLQWRTFDVGLYAHSVALTPDGRAWVNGHFTKQPEIIASVDPRDGVVRRYELPLHPTMAAEPGGPIPYEIRAAPDGRLWMSELQGNRLIALSPSTGTSTVHEMPTSFSGPRRFDVDARGILWVPAYSANELVRFDPKANSFGRFPLPIKDAVPYVVRIDHRTGRIWIGTSAADAVLSFDPRTARFTIYELPSRGALVRHLAIDSRTSEVWVAYGASPGIPAKIARIRPS